MSRIPPVSTSRRPQTPSTTDDDLPLANALKNTRPLQVHRPTTPNSSSSYRGTPSSPSGGPSRPQRSGLRTRQVSEHSNSDAASGDFRSMDPRDRKDSNGTNPSSRARNQPQGFQNLPNGSNGYGLVRSPTEVTSPTSETELSPTSLAALAVFKRGAARTKDEHDREREREIAIQKDRTKKIRDRAPARQQTKHRIGDIDAVLDEIRGEWAIVTDPDFNPVDLALQLLDDSSLGKDMESFRRTKHMLSKALRGSVDKHYQAFAGAITHHAGLMNHLTVAQDQVSEARASLQQAKESLGSKRTDLVQLKGRSQTLEEMLRILDQIEHLRSVPDVLESLISEKRLLQASALLVRSLKMINKQDMLDVGALSDLRSYLNTQETALREILVDELHSHLYLKSYWCESRWAAYTSNQQLFPVVDFELEDQTPDHLGVRPPDGDSPISPSIKRSRLQRYLENLAVRPNEAPFETDESTYRKSAIGPSMSPSSSGLGLSQSSSRNFLSAPSSHPFLFDPNRNPEADSFAYIETLLESLALLCKLGNALDIVAQKLPQEVFTLVESTLDEVAERAEYGRRGSMLGEITKLESSYVATAGGYGSGIVGVLFAPLQSTTVASSLRLTALESSTKRTDQEVMRDVFWTLYSKLDAVTQGLRVVYEVSNRIGSRKDFKDSSGAKPGSLFPLDEVWMPVQAEVRTLLNDYITNEEQGSVASRNPISSISEVLRDSRFTRDKGKSLFRFADTDLKESSKELGEHEEQLTQALRETVPGLVHGSAENAAQATLSAVGTDDRLLGLGQHHRLLVHPDAFHVIVLFQPTLSFMERIADVLPSGQEATRSSSTMLDDFVLKVYLPQLEDKVSLLFHQTVTSPDAFQPEPASTRLASQPLIKSSVQLMALINSLCAMLRTTPFHRENYARLILTVIVQFYQRCSDKFQDLVSLRDPIDPESPPRVALAAQWAQLPELVPCLSEHLSVTLSQGPISKILQLCQQEWNLQASLLGDASISRGELISSTKDLSALASLHHSVTWFASELNALKSAPENPLSPTTPLRLEPMSAATPYTPYIPSLAPLLANEQLKLPLSAAMALRFQALHKTYEQLSEVILHSIRIDVRCRAIHHLDLALRHGNYCLEGEAPEPDPHVVDLNFELAQCFDFTSTSLPEAERRFVFEGIGQLMESLLIANAKHIRYANPAGVQKMFRNILALQQSVKTIAFESDSGSFERAKRYYSLFSLSPQALLDSIRQTQEFSFDEYKTMLDLQCGVDTTRPDNNAVQAADRNYSMYVIELHGLELENSGVDSAI